MPYIKIKAYPKDKDTKERVVERINQVFLEEWGCPPQAISISMKSILRLIGTIRSLNLR